GCLGSNVDHRTTKTGKPFGRFTLEDYSGSYTFTLFGEDYLKQRTYMNIGWFQFIEGAVLRNTWGQQNLEFKIRHIDLLNDLGTKRSRGVQVKLSVADITPELIGKIETVCAEFKGDVPLYLKLSDASENISLDLLSRRFRVSPVNEMVKKMKKVADMDVVF